MAVIDGRPRSIALGNVAPLRTGMQFPEDAIERLSVIVPRVPNRAVRREVRLKKCKLLISKLVASHHDAASFVQDFCGMRSRCEATKPDCRTEPKRCILPCDDAS